MLNKLFIVYFNNFKKLELLQLSDPEYTKKLFKEAEGDDDMSSDDEEKDNEDLISVYYDDEDFETLDDLFV